MAGTTVRVVYDHIPKIVANLKTTDRIVEGSAQAIATGAKAACPVDTGRLRDSIHVEHLGAAKRAIGTDVEYAAFVELGTVHQSAQPYLIPAFEAEVPKLQAALKKLVG